MGAFGGDAGLHEIVWREVDEYMGDVLAASPADAHGRGIAFSMEHEGAAVDLAGSQVYLVWRHRASGKRGCEPFANDASGCRVFYPAALAECAGTVDAQVMVSFPDGRSISTRAFRIRVEPVLVGGAESEDGFTLFVDAIKKYEAGTERVDELLAVLDDVGVIKGEKGDKGDPGEPGRDGADGAPGRDGKDGADGAPGRDGADGLPGRDGVDGKDGVGIASVRQTTTSLADGGLNVVTVTLTDGRTSDFEVRNGSKGSAGAVTGDGGVTVVQGEKGDKGDKGDPFTYEDFTPEQLASLKGEKGDRGDKGDRGEQGIQGERGEKGEAGVPGKDGADGKPFTFADFTEEQLASLKGDKGEKGDRGDVGEQGIQGEKGEKGATGAAFTYEDFTPEQLAALKGAKGDKGDAGAAFTYDMFTAEQLAQLKGEKGDTGAAGATGAAGRGVAAGGASGQVLAKASGADFDTEWIDPPTPSIDAYTKAEIDAMIGNMENALAVVTGVH